jgi:hypothetical protein
VLIFPPHGGGTIVTGCAPCSAHVVSVDVEPMVPALTVKPSICNVGDETLEIDNATPDPLQLTSAFFLPEGQIGLEGGIGVNTFLIPNDTTTRLVAGPNAVGVPVVALSGTIADTPITITVTFSATGDAGGVAEASAPKAG